MKIYRPFQLLIVLYSCDTAVIIAISTCTNRVAAPPTGQFWQTDDSDSEEEEEKTAGWKAGRTAATFERYTRFADLDAVASRRPVM